MKYTEYIELDRRIDDLYERNRFQEALNELNVGLNTLPEKEIIDYYFELMLTKAFLLASIEDYDQCIEVVKDVLQRGYSFPIHFKRFHPLRNKAGYEDLIMLNEKLLAELRTNAKAKYEVHLPVNYDAQKKYPLFIALHGDGLCNTQEFSRYWKPDVFLSNNLIFVYVQSSQVLCHNGYGWLNNLEAARRDIKDCYDLVAAEYLIDDSAIFIGGFSGGAITSIDFTMSNVLQIKGFIALCPEIKPEVFTKENVKLAAQRGVRGVFMEGELVLPMESEEEMLKVFDETGLSYQYYINKGIGHRAPNDFDDKLRQALHFIHD